MTNKKRLTTVLAATAAAIAAGGLFAADKASADLSAWYYDAASSSGGTYFTHAGYGAEVVAATDLAGNSVDYSTIVGYSSGGYWIDVESLCYGADPPIASEYVTGLYEAATTEDCPVGSPYSARGRIED